MSDNLSEATLKLMHLHMLMLGSALKADGDGTLNDSKSAYKLCDYVMVAAVDFGTTFSGYAFSFKSNKDDIKMNKNWGAETGFQSYKTPTCILVDKNKEFVSFGYEAQHAYGQMVDFEQHDYSLFERFKMKLHSTKNLGKDTLITATNGRQMSAVDIFSMSLKFLKDHMTDAISKALTSGIDDKMIRWVITVPAIWSDASKQFMRQAALQATLINELDSGQLVIALEPEAASLFVRNMDVNQFERGQNRNIQVGTKYLVLDAGGGTLDVTAHQIQDHGKVKELHYATGGALGGTKVDEQFIKMMEDIFDKKFIDIFKKECPSQWTQIMIDFEKKKRTTQSIKSININMPWSFGTIYHDKMAGGNIEAVVRQCSVKGVRFANGLLCFDGNAVKALFEPVLQGIIAHIKDLMKKPQLQDVEYFFCVGGFNESKVLQDAIEENFGNQVKILLPSEASLAIVKGAVQFGHAPDTISSRVSSATYGIKSLGDFVPLIHPKSKAIIVNGRVRCNDKFNTYVSKGQEVPVGFTKTMQFSPCRENQDEAEVNIYSTNQERAAFVTDEGVDHHGTISVNWPGEGLDRSIKITMTFGGTEVQVAAVTYPGGNSTETKINFLTE